MVDVIFERFHPANSRSTRDISPKFSCMIAHNKQYRAKNNERNSNSGRQVVAFKRSCLSNLETECELLAFFPDTTSPSTYQKRRFRVACTSETLCAEHGGPNGCLIESPKTATYYEDSKWLRVRLGTMWSTFNNLVTRSELTRRQLKNSIGLP